VVDRRRGDERQRIGDGGVDPVDEHLPDVARIVRVAIEVVGARLELGTEGGGADGDPEQEEQGDRKEASGHLTHACMLTRASAAGFGNPEESPR
jgi:hypothetical protein